MAKSLTPADESRMLDAVKRAHDHIVAGDTPDDAVEKIARELKCGAGEIAAMCHAINTGRQLRQWEKGASALERMAPFALASPEEVTRRIYTSEKTASVDPDYDRPPTWLGDPETIEKQAYALPAGLGAGAAETAAPVMTFSRASAHVRAVKSAVDQLTRDKRQALEKVSHAISRLASYFKQANYDRDPFAPFESALASRFGERGQVLADAVYEEANLHHRREKRAEGKVIPLRQPYDEKRLPYSLVKECFDTGETAVQSCARLQAALVKAAEVEAEVMRPFSKAGDVHEKTAGPFNSPAVGAGIATALMGGVRSGPELVEKATTELDDPSHLNEMRRIKAMAMLNGMMTDPDNPISSFEPDAVMRAYNEISQAAPRAADTSATLAPLLRRKLEGHYEPFEAKELIDTEKSLAETRSRGSLLGHPKNIFG